VAGVGWLVCCGIPDRQLLSGKTGKAAAQVRLQQSAIFAPKVAGGAIAITKSANLFGIETPGLPHNARQLIIAEVQLQAKHDRA
jgi:hypothetical protein